jgi:hypothetical protein
MQSPIQAIPADCPSAGGHRSARVTTTPIAFGVPILGLTLKSFVSDYQFGV